MDPYTPTEPLSQKTRGRAFLFLVLIFIVSLPFLYLYATGYRFDVTKPTTLISTGGIYIAVDRTGAEIYINDELMRETRTFRKAFYAQGLTVATHRVHVQKEGHHTWVKELPVSRHLVTEAQAFNLPLVPQVRVISEWRTATGTAVIPAPLTNASSTNAVFATTTTNTLNFIKNEEYAVRLDIFLGTSTVFEIPPTGVSVTTEEVATTSNDTATSTVVSGRVRLYQEGEDVYAQWVGSFNQMPYYYCAPEFPRYSTTTPTTTLPILVEDMDKDELPNDEFVMHPVQTVSPDIACDPTIRIDRMWQTVHDFNFFPGSTDLVLMMLDTGVYVVEVDNRAWQNAQPLFLGENLQMYIEAGTIYLYDGVLIYQIVPETE